MPGRATILVVEDDPDVRETSIAILEANGYRTFSAGNGREALRVLAEHPEITLLLSDIMMPVMGGFALARQAKVLRPDLKVLYASGYPDEDIQKDNGPRYGRIIRKPFRAKELAAWVKATLDS